MVVNNNDLKPVSITSVEHFLALIEHHQFLLILARRAFGCQLFSKLGEVSAKCYLKCGHSPSQMYSFKQCFLLHFAFTARRRLHSVNQSPFDSLIILEVFLLSLSLTLSLSLSLSLTHTLSHLHPPTITH